MKILSARFFPKGIKFILVLMALFVAWMVWSAAYKLFWIAMVLAAIVALVKMRGLFKKNN